MILLELGTKIRERILYPFVLASLIILAADAVYGTIHRSGPPYPWLHRMAVNSVIACIKFLFLAVAGGLVVLLLTSASMCLYFAFAMTAMFDIAIHP
jgi:hypothetical protein